DDPRVTVQHRQNLALAYGVAGRENDARKIALQDLPRASVEKNIATYRKMREKIMGIKSEAAPKPAPVKKPETKKAQPKKPAEKKVEDKKGEKKEALPNPPSPAELSPVTTAPPAPAITP
ncbi:MAG: hypothetical protein K2Q32_08510, partial [Alphaproteobacteria bacterium]|nr:hypothetical protein [Alphaproteobacteria bacterium]